MADSCKLPLAFEATGKCFLSVRDGVVMIELRMSPPAVEINELKRLIGDEPKVAAFTSIDSTQGEGKIVIFMTFDEHQ